MEDPQIWTPVPRDPLSTTRSSSQEWWVYLNCPPPIKIRFRWAQTYFLKHRNFAPFKSHSFFLLGSLILWFILHFPHHFKPIIVDLSLLFSLEIQVGQESKINLDSLSWGPYSRWGSGDLIGCQVLNLCLCMQRKHITHCTIFLWPLRWCFRQLWAGGWGSSQEHGTLMFYLMSPPQSGDWPLTHRFSESHCSKSGCFFS